MQYSNENISRTENKQVIKGLFDKFVSEAKNSYSIPEEAFANYRVKRGLREADGTGVTAGVTKIGNAHGYIVNEGEKVPDEGVLEYRGYNIIDLIENYAKDGRYGFEECTYLLFFGSLPTVSQLADFNTLLDAYRRLPSRYTEDILMKAPCRSLMNKISTGVLALYAYDENPDDTSLENMLRQSVEITARMPVIAAHSYAIFKNCFCDRSLHLHNPRPEYSTAQNFLRVLRSDKSFTEEEAHLLDLCLVIHAEHGGGNNSTFACRVLSSSGTDTYSAISAAVGSLKGPRHGGANIEVQGMFDNIKENVTNIKDDGALSDYLLKILKGDAYDGSGLVYGMGHAIYTVSDPRTVMLKRYARKLAEEKGFSDDFELLERIERLTPQIFNTYKNTNKIMCANVDLYSGLVYRMLGIPEELYTPLFAIARVAGWCAHRMEEYSTAHKIIRPGYKCIEHEHQYTPIKER